MNDFLLQDHDVVEMKYDLAEYYHFHIPTTERVELKTGQDIAEWVRKHVDRAKAEETQDFVPRLVRCFNSVETTAD